MGTLRAYFAWLAEYSHHAHSPRAPARASAKRRPPKPFLTDPAALVLMVTLALEFFQTCTFPFQPPPPSAPPPSDQRLEPPSWIQSAFRVSYFEIPAEFIGPQAKGLLACGVVLLLVLVSAAQLVSRPVRGNDWRDGIFMQVSVPR
jgi:hypothetical protein